MTRRLALALAAAALAGCGGGEERAPLSRGEERAPLPRDPPAVGPGPRYRPPALGAAARRGDPIATMKCARESGDDRFGVHLELFAHRRVVTVPAGIGIAPPRRERGAYVNGGRCSYPLRTREPTGVVEVAGGGERRTLGDLFDVWGQPLTPGRMAAFRGRVRAWVGGREWRDDPRAIPLERHAQITLEVGGYVRPHASYRFPPGL